jgi:hypothetical protein
VQLFRKVKRPDLASIAEQIASGGSTTGDKMDINKSCPICGAEDSSEHRTYQCTELGGLMHDKWESDWWSKTKWLCDKGAVKAYLNLGEGMELHEVLRYRGLVPNKHSHAIVEGEQWALQLGQAEAGDELWHTDGSKPGNKEAGTTSIATKCGAGSVCMKLNGHGE